MELSKELSVKIGELLTSILSARYMQDYSMRERQHANYWVWAAQEREAQIALCDLGIVVDIRRTKEEAFAAA